MVLSDWISLLKNNASAYGGKEDNTNSLGDTFSNLSFIKNQKAKSKANQYANQPTVASGYNEMVS